MTILLKIRKKDWITLCHHERDGKKDLAIICTMFCTNTAKADTDLPWDESEIAETSTCVVNGKVKCTRYPLMVRKSVVLNPGKGGDICHPSSAFFSRNVRSFSLS